MKFRWIAILAAALLAGPLAAQVPDTLQYSIPAPPVGVQSGAQLGYSVAVDGGYTVVGVPYDDIGGADSGVVKVFNSTTGALLHVLPNPSPEANDVFGFSVAVSGTRVVVGAYRDNSGSSGGGSAYVYDLGSGTPTVPVATLHNPGAAGSGSFGYAVAISGTRVVVCMLMDNLGASTVGAAYAYDVAGGTPTVPIAVWRSPYSRSLDRYGMSVAISGTRVVVGALEDDTGASDAGSAYVYDLGSGIPSVPVQILNNPSPAVADNFGSAVAISGTRVVVGAHQDDTGASNAGSAYVYDLSSGTPTVPVTTLNNPSPASSDTFGKSVAISGVRVVVGTNGDDTGAGDAGRAYVYDLSVSYVVAVHTLNNPSPGGGDQFGYAVAISGPQVVVGAYRDDLRAGDAGSAYGYDLGSGMPTVPIATFNHPGSGKEDHFGSSVAVSGTRLIVGVPGDDTRGANLGIAYVYDLGSGTPAVPVATLPNSGDSVAISGALAVVGGRGITTVYDLGSGTPAAPIATINTPTWGIYRNPVAISGMRVVVGAPYDSVGAAYAGSVSVYDLGGATPTVPVAVLNNPDPEEGDYFGSSVAISGTRLVVGAVLDNSGAPNAGGAYVYDLASGTPNIPVATLSDPSPGGSERFGISVAISGTRVVVGADRKNTGVSGVGSAYVYDLASVTPTEPVATLNNPAATYYFAYSVAISGTRVVVGSFQEETSYVYDLGSSPPILPVATLQRPGSAGLAWFGASVAIDGGTVAIGAPYDDAVMLDKGYAYVFAPSPVPDIRVEAPLGNMLMNGGVGLDFGMQAVDGGSIEGIVHRITNPAAVPLTGLALTIGGDAAGDFTASALPPETLAPGASFQFTVWFDPSVPGERAATLSLASDDADENPFTVPLHGTGLTTQEAWRLQYFGETTNTGNAADDEDPDGDGHRNLFEYVAGLVPNDPASRFLLRVELVVGEAGQKAVVFGPVIGGRTYVVKSRGGLDGGTWEVLTSFTTSDADNERTVIDLGAGTGERFYRVELTKP